MLPEDEYFVSTCSHVNESPELDASGQRRAEWIRKRAPLGLRVKVGLLNGAHAGFAYLLPVEQAPWQIVGQDCLYVPCAWVLPSLSKQGVGQCLLEACEAEARRQGRKALVAGMPRDFLAKRGYVAARQEGKAAIYWKVFDPSAMVPGFLKAQSPYVFAPVPGKLVVDLFWNSFCQTSEVEAARVRKVAREFGEQIILREYCADNRQILLRYAQPRGIYVNGRRIGWGYEAPEDGLRDSFSKALAELRAQERSQVRNRE
jgi:GNAT superfamily N-acetyltransferase